jgi:hypothetical protein
MAGFERTPEGPDTPKMTDEAKERIWQNIRRRLREECAGEEPIPDTPAPRHLEVVDEDFTAGNT